MLVGTLGKAFGSFGAFVAGPAELIEYLMQKARSYIYTTALPQPVAAASRAALALVRSEGWRRARAAASTGTLSRRRRAPRGCRSWTRPRRSSRCCSAARARRCVQGELAAGGASWSWPSARPTVPAGSARLRVTLSAAHSEAQVDALVVQLARGLCAALRRCSA